MKTSSKDRSLKIAFVTDTFDDGYGGGVVSAARFVEGLRKDHKVTVLTTGEGGEDRVTLKSMTFPLLAMRAMRFRFAVPDRERMRAAFADVDVVHLQFPFIASFSAMKIAREMSKPVVAAFHVQPENILQNLRWSAQWPVRLLYWFWVKYFYNRADLVVCPSEHARQALIDAGLRRPAPVISNGVPQAFFQNRELRRDVAVDAPRTLLMVGRLAQEKQHSVVFDALRSSRHRNHVRLLVAGAGPLESELRERVRDRPEIELLGYVSDEHLAQLYQQADLLVHASDVELEGMVVLEAMARGLPVLVSDSPRSAAAQFTLSAAYRFANGDAADLAKRLDALLDNPVTLAQSRVQHAQRAKRYAFDDSVSALVEVYRKACGIVPLTEKTAAEAEPAPATRKRGTVASLDAMANRGSGRPAQLRARNGRTSAQEKAAAGETGSTGVGWRTDRQQTP